MSVNVTPFPHATPPYSRIDVTTDDPNASFTSLTLTRDGAPLRRQPFVGTNTATAFDFEAPFGAECQYVAAGTLLPPVAPDWTEAWASLAAWSGDTSDWAVAGGEASSSDTGATISRSASGAIQRIDVSDIEHATVQLLTAGDVVVVSIAVTDNVVISGDTAIGVPGAGGFTATLLAGTVTVTGDGWSGSVDYSGTPTKVRLVSGGGQVTALAPWDSVGGPHDIVELSDGKIAIFDTTNSRIRVFSSAGVPVANWAAPNCVGIARDASDNIYTVDFTAKLVRKFSSSGSAITTWSTTGIPSGIGISGSNVFVLDYQNSLVRKYGLTGTVVDDWDVDSDDETLNVSGGLVLLGDPEDNHLHLYDLTGTPGVTISTAVDPRSAAVDADGNIWLTVAGSSETVQKRSAGGTLLDTFTVLSAHGIAVTAAGTVLVGDLLNRVVRPYGRVTAMAGAIAVLPTATEDTFIDSDFATLAVEEAWLIHAAIPSLSVSIDPGPIAGWREDGINVDIASSQQRDRAAQRTLHRPVGRTRAVAITNGSRQEAEWALVLMTPRLSDRDAVVAILADQMPLLLRSPASFGWDLADGWYSIGDVPEVRVFQGLQHPDRRLTLPLTPVDEPIVTQGSLRDWEDVATENADWLAVKAKYADWLAVATGDLS